MVGWSRKIVTYFVFQVAKTLFIDQIKLIQLDCKVIDCVFNGYPRGRKGYEMLGVEHRGSKLISYRCVIFSKSCQKKKNKDMRMKLLVTIEEKTQFEVEVSTMDTNSSKGVIAKAYDYHQTSDNVIKVGDCIISNGRLCKSWVLCLNMAKGLQKLINIDLNGGHSKVDGFKDG